MTLIATPSAARSSERDRLQVRTLAALVTAQLIGGLGLAASVTVGGLVANELAGPSATGLPLSAAVAGASTSALGLGALMHRRGRRYGLRVGWLLGTAGALLAVFATTAGSLPMLLVAMFLFGSGEAASAASRYAAADLARRPATAMGTVLFVTAIATTAGPLLVGPATATAAGFGLPPLSGPFLLAVVAFAGAAAVVTAALRPDPLLSARGERRTSDGQPAGPSGAVWFVLRDAAARRGVLSLACGNVVMIAVMTVVPVHVGGHGSAALGHVGVLLALHIGAMYAPAPVTGRLADRIGGSAVTQLGAAVLVAAALLAWLHLTPWMLGGALVLLGVGWNLTFVGGSLTVTEALAPADRARGQAGADAVMSAAGALGSVAAGVVLAAGGFGAVSLVTAGLAGALWVHGRRFPRGRRAGMLGTASELGALRHAPAGAGQ